MFDSSTAGRGDDAASKPIDREALAAEAAALEADPADVAEALAVADLMARLGTSDSGFARGGPSVHFGSPG